jgi:hypothetical protein
MDKEQVLNNAWEYVSAMLDMDLEWKPPKDATRETLECFKKHQEGV